MNTGVYVPDGEVEEGAAVESAPFLQADSTDFTMDSPTHSVIFELSQRILSVLSVEPSTEKQRISASLQALPTIVEELRKSTKYDYSDYADRLLAEEGVLQYVFETRILTNPSVASAFAPVGRLLSDEVFRSQPKFRTELLKKIRRTYFDRLTYEELRPEEYTKLNEMRYLSQGWYFSDIDTHIGKAKENGYETLGFEFSSWGSVLTADEVLFLVRKIGDLKFTNLSLWHTEIWPLLGASGMIELVRIAGERGIKKLELWDNDLVQVLGASGMIELVRVAGKSGIRSLSISQNDILEPLGLDKMVEIVKTAGLSGIREFDIMRHISNKFDYQWVVRLIQTFWKYGIRNLDLSLSDLATFFTFEQVLMLIHEAGKIGIFNLNFSYNALASEFGKSELMTLVWKVGRSGIPSLILNWCNLGMVFNESNFTKFVVEAGKGGVRYLDVCQNGLRLSNEPSNIYDFVQETVHSWIRSLNLKKNQLASHQIQKIEESAKSLSLHIL